MENDIRKKSLISILVFMMSFTCVFAKEPNKKNSLKRLSLMSYVSYTESLYNFNLDWPVKTTSIFNIMSKAHAYKEGDPCLILGFQSTFKNGMCRLSLANGARKFRNSCHKGSFACNPQVFGTKSDKPFCVSSSLGNELSKYCSYQSIVSLSTDQEMVNYSTKTKKALLKIKKTSPQDFNFNMIVDATDDEAFNNGLSNLFKDPNTLENAKEYTRKICSSIQSSRMSKNQALDIKTCSEQVEILSSKKLDDTKVKKAITKHDREPAQKREIVHKIDSKIKDISEPVRVCTPPKASNETLKTIEDIKDVTANLEGSLYMKCINELYYHDDLPETARGQYFHKIGDKVSFAKQCWEIDNHGENEIVHTFVSDEGFKMIKYPVFKYSINNGQIETSLPRNIMKFYDGDKAYFISNYRHIGQNFDTLPVDELSQYISDNDLGTTSNSINSRYIKPYEKFLERNNLSKKIQLTTPQQAGYTDDAAKSCIKDRLKEYINIMMFRSHGKVFPYHQEINEHLAVSDRSSLRHRYIKTTDEIKASLKTKLLPNSSACSTIIDDNDFDQAFEKAYGNRIKNYNEYRKYFLK